MTKGLKFAVWATLGFLLFAMSSTHGEEPKPNTPVLTAEQQQRMKQAQELDDRAIKLHLQGKSAEAAPLAKQVLNIRRQVLGEEHPDTATCLNNLGNVLFSMGDYAAARPHYEQSLKIRKKVLGEEHPDTAMSQNNLGNLFRLIEDYAAARPYHEQALKTRKKVLGDEHPDTATSLDDLGLLLDSTRDYAAAQPYFEQALKIRKKVLGDEHPETANSLDHLGGMHYSMNEYATAQPYYEQALKIRKKVLGEEHLDTANSQNILGNLMLARGDYAASRSYYEQALRIRMKALGEEHSDTAQSLNNLGFLLTEQGDYTAARPYCEKALAVQMKVFGEEDPITALYLNNLGMLLIEQGEEAVARPYLEQALKINKKVLGEEDAETARSLNNLGYLLQAQGDFAAALPYYEHALKVFKKALGEEHLDTAWPLGNLGLLRQYQGEYASARLYFEQAHKICKKVLGDEHPDTAASIDHLAALEAAFENWDSAIRRTDQARRAIHRHVSRVLIALTEKEQIAFLERRDQKPRYAALTVGLFHSTDREQADLSAGWLLNTKAVAQTALASRTLLARDSNNPKFAATVKELLRVRGQLAVLSLSVPKPGQEAARKQALQELTDQEAQLARRLAQDSGQTEVAEAWAELATLRKSLPTDSILIDIARFDIFDFQARGKEKKFQPAHYAAWIVPAVGAGDVRIVDLGLAETIDDAVATVRKSIVAAGKKDGVLQQQGEQIAEQQVRDDLQRLADLVWKPLADKVGDAKRLVISPDASLWLVPWGALPIGNDKLLIEQYVLEHVVSGRDIVAAAQPRDHSRQNPPVIFANPAFDMTAADVQRQNQAILGKAAIPVDDTAQRSLTQLGKSALPKALPLPGTQVEAQAITPPLKSLSGTDPQVYVGRNALESVFKAVHRPKVVTLSTHGFFLPDQEVKHDDNRLASTETRALPLTIDGQRLENPLLRSGLLFSGCNNPDSTGTDDGVLTGLEIVGIDLRGTELVVLSACETGVGTVRNGEGVAGLRQAFQLAGAEAVVATLWQVPDAESARLMNDFFANLAAGQSRGDALRNAQLKRIAARRDKFGAAHPFFWAAFTLTGQ